MDAANPAQLIKLERKLIVQLFDVTYETWDDESLESGDKGFISRNERLRDAVSELMQSSPFTDTREIATNCWPDNGTSTWITVYNGTDWETGETTNKSLHRPDGISNASWRRIVKLIKG